MFTNKVVLVTGASSGIGAQTAIDFAKLNAKLVITARNEERLNNVAKSCEENSPNKLKPLVVVLDINNHSKVGELINKAIAEFHQLDVLVNNLGIFETGSLENTSLDQYDIVMETNVRSQLYLTKLALPHIIETKGNIVNVSSVAGVKSFPNIVTYSMSKAALDQFTRCVALEVAPKGVRVNAVNPGVITTGIHLRGSTRMTEQQFEEYLIKCKETHALGRPGEAKEVSSVITFLASNAASFVTGVTLPVDGGRHAMCPR